jgi:excisionase family DNA binding protein
MTPYDTPVEPPKNPRNQQNVQPFQPTLQTQRHQAKRMRRGRAKRMQRHRGKQAQGEDAPQPNRLAWPIPEGARRMGISRTTVYKLAGEGKLRLIKIAGRTLIPDAEIVRLVDGD